MRGGREGPNHLDVCLDGHGYLIEFHIFDRRMRLRGRPGTEDHTWDACFLKEAGINVLYLYPYLGRGESGQPIVIMGIDKTEEALRVLRANWVHTFSEEIYAL